MANLDVRYVARLARLDLSDSEASDFQAQLTDILGYIAKLDSLNVDGLEATVHAEDTAPLTRPDTARPGFSAEQALSNAPAAANSLFLTPRVVE